MRATEKRIMPKVYEIPVVLDVSRSLRMFISLIRFDQKLYNFTIYLTQ